MEKKKSTVSQKKNIAPLVWRRTIPMLGAFVAFVTFALSFTSWDYDLTFIHLASIYITAVVLIDLCSYRFFEKRVYESVSPKWVKKELEVTLPNLKRYFRSRFILRIGSFGISAAAALLTQSWIVLVGTYAIITLAGYIVYYFANPDIRPLLIKRDDRYYQVGGTPGSINPGQLALAFEGKHPFGPIET
jgi:hypothetical protein